MKWITPVLLLIGVGHVLLGLVALYAPDTAAGWLGLQMTTVGARGEVRAMFGGLLVGLGVAVLRGAMGGAGARPSLFAVATCYVGLVAGRLLSIGMDGVSGYTLLTGLLEGAIAVTLFWAGMDLDPEVKSGVKPAVAPAPPSSGAADEEPDDR